MFNLLRKVFQLFRSHEKVAKERIKKLEKIISHKIDKPELFLEALTHRSVLDSKRFKTSNERLEFLGDAVLGFIIARELYHRFPEKDEGYLTKTRSNFVNKNSLFEAGKRIELQNLLFINTDLMNSGNFGQKTVVSDAFEALIGAIYLVNGFEVTVNFIKRYVVEPNFQLKLHLIDENFKSQLLELAQSVKLDIPRYYVILEEGPEHDRIFTVEARIGTTTLGTGKGKNKKAAEQEAARQALAVFSQTMQPSTPAN